MNKIKINYNAPFTLTFCVLASVVFLFSVFFKELNSFLATPPSFSYLRYPVFYLGIFLHPLAHANFQHLSSNLTIMLLVSPALEEKFGALKMFFMALITAFATSMLEMLLFSGSSLIGASGIVFMMILLSSFTGGGNGFPLTAVLVLLFYVGQEVISSFKSDNISQSAHIIGGVLGMIFGLISRKRILDKNNTTVKSNFKK